MDKRYQVFISSTFKDLIVERQSVLKAVLELDQMPAGMELFPASDETAWQLIRDVIDASDYYIVVVGGRYGTLDEAGIGYTEKEYDYAYEGDKPVIPLLHKQPGKLARELTDTDEAAWNKLVAFRAKLETRHTCTYWTTADELKAQAIIGLTTAMKRRPGGGWVRADEVPTNATIAEVLTLRNKVNVLEAELASSRSSPPAGSEDLQQGDDEIEVPVSFRAREAGGYQEMRYTGRVRVTWNEVFAAVAPTMIDKGTDTAFAQALEAFFNDRAREAFKDDKALDGRVWTGSSINTKVREDATIQFRALGLIRESDSPRSVRDTRTYWTLTPYGDTLMTQLRAARRTSATPSETPPAPAKMTRKRTTRKAKA